MDVFLGRVLQEHIFIDDIAKCLRAGKLAAKVPVNDLAFIVDLVIVSQLQDTNCILGIPYLSHGINTGGVFPQVVATFRGDLIYPTLRLVFCNAFQHEFMFGGLNKNAWWVYPDEHVKSELT